MDCNIRNIDPELMKRMKVLAAEEGITLRDWCIRTLSAIACEATTSAEMEELVKKYPPDTGPKISKPKSVKPSENKSVEPCRHGLIYHPGCRDDA